MEGKSLLRITSACDVCDWQGTSQAWREHKKGASRGEMRLSRTSL